jgi:D-alanyl-lipoteichoic acid acyltransferase DltB (MBOAT superfamily)
LDYFIARKISKSNDQQQKKTLLMVSLLSNIGVLFVFKYFVFVYNSSVEVFDLDAKLLHNLIIPAGLSFYTFQSISYTIDVYRGKYKADDTLSDFLLYVSFFPHMVAGPIVRYNDLMPQFKIITYFKNINWQQVATLVIWGYFKKLVIADNLNLIVTPVFNNVTAFTGFELALAGFLFVIQVYCDFSGYSDIATGVAKLFNINLSLNWRRPLLSKSLHEFWKRNHISITTWFRDYLYIGLGHGANFTFIIWGTMHGLLYILEIILNKMFPTIKVPGVIGRLYLLGFHTLSLIAFRANNLLDLRAIYSKIFTLSKENFMINSLLKHQDRLYFFIIFLLIVILFIKEINEEYAIINKNKTVYSILKPLAFILFIVLIFTLGNFSANTFIYFQF